MINWKGFFTLMLAGLVMYLIVFAIRFKGESALAAAGAKKDEQLPPGGVLYDAAGNVVRQVEPQYAAAVPLLRAMAG